MSDGNTRDSNNSNNEAFNDDGDCSQKKQQQQQQQPRQCEHNVLLTKKALALALSAPRAPPIGSAHRSLLLGQDPSYTPWTHHYRVRELHQDIHNHAHEILEHEQAVQLYNNNNNNNSGSRHHSVVPHGRCATLLQERLRQRLHRSHHHHHHYNSYHPNEYHYTRFHPRRRRRLPHPHLPNGPELGDQMTRFLGLVLPLSWQHTARDSGTARILVDAIVTVSAPLIALQKPTAVLDFINLSQRVKRVPYGLHKRQYIDLLEPNKEEIKNSNRNSNSSSTDDTAHGKCRRRLIFFVHGGAWGSGQAWMYRLVAKTFLQQGYAVAILSYRVYPDGPNKSSAIIDQVEDCHLAAQHLQSHYPHFSQNVTVMGHSSGAHVSLYWLVERAKRQMIKACSLHNNAKNNNSQEQLYSEPLTIDSYIGIAGPYDISHHFDFEAARGVEEFSPMKPVCGYTRRNFRIHSPALNLLDFLARTTTTTMFDTNTSSNSTSSCNNNNIRNDVVEHYFPPIVLVHGVEDETVPFTATAEAARVLRSCGVVNVQELYNESVQHQEAVMQLMLGGVVLNEILDWIQRLPRCNNSNMNNRSHGDYATTLSSSSSSTASSRAPPLIRSKL